MRKSLFILTILILLVKDLFSQTVTSSHTILWADVVKETLNTNNVEAISFTGAIYPTEEHLPYFMKRIICDPAFSYELKLKNPIYIPTTPTEAKSLEGHIFTSQAKTTTDQINIKGVEFIDFQVLPFVNTDGKLMKLKSFEIETIKTDNARKTKAATIQTYASSSVLANGHFIKIGIAETGVYKLTYEKLVALGLDPQNVHVFGFGGGVLEQSFLLPKIDDLPEIPIYIEKGTDGIFGAGDYLLFYGQGVVRWGFDATKSMFTHTNNPYSQLGYYFISSDAVNSSTKNITLQPAETPAAGAVIKTITEFTDYKVSEKELRSLPKAGKEFYGDVFSSNLTYTYDFTFPNVVTTPSTIARLDVAATASTTSNFVLKLNDAQSKTLSVAAKSSDVYQLAMAAGSTTTHTFTPTSDLMSYSVKYSKPTTASIGYMNFLEVNARRSLKMTGDIMPFQNTDWTGKGYYNNYLLSNANVNTQIWDITNPLSITKVETTLVGSALSFTASSNTLKQYIAINTLAASSFLTPVSEAAIANQNIHAIQQADMVILTHPDFLSAAQKLAQAHRVKDNLTVEVVTSEQVYNEFSSGTPDATAYRWIMKMLYDRATIPANLPKYLLLFGRGTYDNRKLNIETESGDNFILTYQADNSLSMTNSYVTDDYFTFLNDNEGTNIPAHTMDIGVGRFPVTTAQQAEDVVNKTLAYMENKDKGNWKNQICFLADDGDVALHMRQADTILSSLTRSFPAFQANKLYLDAYLQETSASGQTYPLAKTKFRNLLQSGVLMLNYTGHASLAGWTNEQILTSNEVSMLSNNHLPFWWAAACDFMQFDIKTISGGEKVVLNPNGGGIGMVSAARAVYASQNLTLNRYFSDNIYKKVNGAHQRVGDVIAAAKNSVGTQVNKLAYIYMGDPALTLNYPTKYKVITKSINEGQLAGNDTLRALSTVTISGIITDESGTTKSNFNGKLHTTIYDKSQKIVTLNNDKDGGVLTYSDRPNTLYAGDVVVKNGNFNLSFLLPRDIKYNYGTGRINYYAQDDLNNYEAQGYFENFIVGGSNNNFISETDGPQVQLYLNDSIMLNSKVNETPLFVANISDINGINSCGTGIGHDILLTIDQDPNQSYILNEYAQSIDKNKTHIEFKLPELLIGKHTLTFRVWDLLNNSTTKTLDFEVVKGLSPALFSISNYPNPVITNTRFQIKNEKPESVLSTSIEVIDLTGRKLWSSTTENNAEEIAWNLKTNDGKKLNSGVYLYRVVVKTKENQIFTQTKKLLIVAP